MSRLAAWLVGLADYRKKLELGGGAVPFLKRGIKYTFLAGK